MADAAHAHPRSAWVWATCRRCPLSRSSFARRVTDAVGLAPITYLSRRWMARAKAALVTERLTLDQVAERTGYGSAGALSHAFLAHRRLHAGRLCRRHLPGPEEADASLHRSAGCGLAGSAAALIGARAVQGVGAALCIPTSLALLHDSFPAGSARTHAASIWGGLGGLALAAGPVMGGLMVDRLGWPSIFFLNVPVGVAAIALALANAPVSRRGLSAAWTRRGRPWPPWRWPDWRSPA